MLDKKKYSLIYNQEFISSQLYFIAGNLNFKDAVSKKKKVMLEVFAPERQTFELWLMLVELLCLKDMEASNVTVM